MQDGMFSVMKHVRRSNVEFHRKCTSSMAKKGGFQASEWTRCSRGTCRVWCHIIIMKVYVCRSCRGTDSGTRHGLCLLHPPALITYTSIFKVAIFVLN